MALPRCPPFAVETVRSRWFTSGLRGVVLTDRLIGRENPSAEREARTAARDRGQRVLSVTRKSRPVKACIRAALGL